MESITHNASLFPLHSLFQPAPLVYLDEGLTFLLSQYFKKTLIAAVGTLSLYCVFGKLWGTGNREPGLPPGPPTTPILGNALQFPKSFPYLKFTEWCKLYGPIVSVKILNRTIVILSSPEAVKTILDGQGAATGNRPHSHMVYKVTDGLNMIFENTTTSVWKHNRKAIHAFLTPSQLEEYLFKQQIEFVHFLHDILTEPKNIYTHIQRTTASVMIALVYGKRCLEWSGSDAETFFKGAKLFNEVLDPSAHPPIDLFWPLKYVPYVERFGWAKWKPLCNKAKDLRVGLYTKLLGECEERLRKGEGVGCYIETILNKQIELGMTRDEIFGLGEVLIDGGAGTTSSYMQSFVVSLLQKPECQRKAQEEIDRVIGGDRLPTLEDFKSLPYLEAMVREVFRFRPLLPVGLPHVASEDITYKGYRIPKDSIIFMNLWGIYHHPDYFDEENEFTPERYLKNQFGIKKGANLTGFRNNLHFGAGRRICPGETMGMRTIMINTMNLIWAFNFTKDDSGTGNWDLSSYGDPGLELSPLPFTCTITPRDNKRASLIRHTFKALSGSNS